MAAATVSSHMATSTANGATVGGPDDGSDVDNFVSKDLKIMNFGPTSTPASPTQLNCLPTASLSNVIEDVTESSTTTTTTSLVVLMMDNSTQTDGETEDIDEVELQEELNFVESVKSEINDNDNDKSKGIDINCSDDIDNIENDVCECEYEERIIDYDNFRIIEHVIDSRPHKNRRKCRELANHIQIIDNRTNSCKMNQLNNHNNYYNGFTFLRDDLKTNSADCDNIDITIDNRASSQSDSTENISYELIAEKQQFENSINGRVDDNNNTTTTTTHSTDFSDNNDCSIVRVVENLEKLSICFSEKQQQQQQQQKLAEPPKQQLENVTKSRKLKNKQQQQQPTRKPISRKYLNDWDTLAPAASTVATTTTTPQFNSLIALKAFQSKLTPLAPPFHPSGVIDHKITTTTTTTTSTTTSSTEATTTATTANTTAAMYAFERTTIFYKQQQQQQQKQQQQQQTQQQNIAKHQQKTLWSQQYAQHQFTTTTIQKQQSIKQHTTKQQQQQQPTQPPQSQQQQLMPYKTNKKQNKQFNTNQTKQQQQQQQQLVAFQAQQQQQQQQQQQVSLLPTPTSVVSTVPSLTHGQVFPVQFIPLLSPMPPTLSLLLPAQQKSQQQQQGQGQSNALGGNNDSNNSTQQQQQQQQINSNVATMGNAGGAWPLVEAPIFIDANGEYCTYCPAHGTPLMAGPPPAPPPPPPSLATSTQPPSLPVTANQAQAALLPPQGPVPTATYLTQQRQQHSKHIPMIGVTPNHQQQQQQQQQQQSREGCNLLSSSSANNSIGTTPSGSPSPTPNPSTLGQMPTAVPVYFKLESGVTTLPLQIAGKSTVLRGK